MDIELVNGSTIKTVESNNTVRGRRTELYKLWNKAEYRELTKEEEELIQSFINPNTEWETEYEAIWISSNDEQ